MTTSTDWKSEYESLMKSCGFRDPGFLESKNRKHSRLAFKTGTTVSIHMEPEFCQIVNISVGGISFYSDISLPSGHTISITLGESLSLNLRVDSCHIEELEPVLMVTSHRYLVGAEFISESDGYRVMSEVLKSNSESLFELTAGTP
ncbi:MAG: PilZ domain-containing protein [SAR324 cluster bacterium]|nr:PilZ domain-containing protein [SAR324 cluster bacterium]